MLEFLLIFILSISIDKLTPIYLFDTSNTNIADDAFLAFYVLTTNLVISRAKILVSEENIMYLTLLYIQ